MHKKFKQKLQAISLIKEKNEVIFGLNCWLIVHNDQIQLKACATVCSLHVHLEAETNYN